MSERLRRMTHAELCNEAWDTVPLAFLGIVNATIFGIFAMVVWIPDRSLWAIPLGIVAICCYCAGYPWAAAIAELERRK